MDDDGTTVMVSEPFAVPDKSNPNVYTLPLMLILDGVALLKVFVPPLMDIVKSLACNAPLPPVALNTASLKVTSMVGLSAATVVLEIVGLVVSAVVKLRAVVELIPA